MIESNRIYPKDRFLHNRIKKSNFDNYIYIQVLLYDNFNVLVMAHWSSSVVTGGELKSRKGYKVLSKKIFDLLYLSVLKIEDWLV